MGRVQGAGLDGLESYCWSEADCKVIDILIVRLLRRLLRGRAHQVAEDKHTAWSNHDVLRYWKILPTKYELACRRIRWLQDMVRLPEEHSHIISCLWGKAKFEKLGSLNELGHLTQEAPWLAYQISEDLATTEGLETAHNFWQGWNEQGRSWKAVFMDENISHDLMTIDPNELRAKFTKGAFGEGVVGEEADELELMARLEKPHACNLLCADQTSCSSRFATKNNSSSTRRKRRGVNMAIEAPSVWEW